MADRRLALEGFSQDDVIEAVVPAYLVRFRKTGQFNLPRNTALASTPDDLAPLSPGPGSQFQPGRATGPIGQGTP